MPLNKSFIEIVEDLKNYILNQAPYLDTKEGSPWTTCFIEPQASELERLFYLIDFVMSNQSIATAAGRYLDSLALNVGLSRKPAIAATGTVTLFTSSPVDSEISIPIGTVVATQLIFNAPAVEFETTERATLATGQNSTDASVRCTVTGSIGNVGEGEITRLVSTLWLVNNVNNIFPMTGGIDVESDSSFYERIKATVFQNSAGTEEGYRSTCINQTGVDTASVIKPEDGDPFSRGPGTVDVILKGANITTYTDYITYEDTYQSYALSKQPVTEIPTTINLVTASGGMPYVIGTYYGGTEPILPGRQDYGIYRGPKISCANVENSIFGSDGLMWLSNTPGYGGPGLTEGTRSPQRPPDGYIFRVENYSYDKTVEDSQLAVDISKCVTADALVRKGEIQYLDFFINLTVEFGSDWDDTKELIKAALIGYVTNTFDLGPKIEFSDLTYDLRTRVSGIDNIQIASVEVYDEGYNLIGTHTRDIKFDSVTSVVVNNITFGKEIVYDSQT